VVGNQDCNYTSKDRNILKYVKAWTIGYNLRKNDSQDLVPNFSRTNGYKHSFFNRIVKEWNSLPIIILGRPIVYLRLKIMF
jgi:hypothetical protein